MTAVAYVAAAALFSTGGVLLLRSSLADMEDLSVGSVRGLLVEPVFLAGFALYVLSFFTWLLALRRYEAITIFPMFVGASYAGVVIGGYLFLGESLTVTRVAGLLVIFGGIVLVAR